MSAADSGGFSGDGATRSQQRLRVVFRKDTDARYISHLDLMRAWERLLMRANLPLAHSQGYNPRPKLTFASALPVGVVGCAEMVDVLLERRMELREFAASVSSQLPSGIELCSAEEVLVTQPSLPSQLIAADYEVTAEGAGTAEELRTRLRLLLAEESIVRQRGRPGRVRTYDLRPLIQRLELERWEGDTAVIAMRLAATAKGTGRPDEVMAALEMSGAVRAIQRVQLCFSPL